MKTLWIQSQDRKSELSDPQNKAKLETVNHDIRQNYSQKQQKLNGLKRNIQKFPSR
jgi:hypothetical protein